MGVLQLPSDLSLDDLVVAAQTTDDSAAMAEILMRFEVAATAIGRSLTTDFHLQQDAAQGARIGLVKAVRRHRAGTPGFPAYAIRYMKGGARRIVAAMRASQETCADPLEPGWQDELPREAPLAPTCEVVDLLSVLRAEQRALVIAHYVEGMLLTEIADAMHVSRSAVTQRMRTIHRVLRPFVVEAVAA